MSEGTRRLVRARADYRCEYCRLPEAFAESPHHVDHVRARQHRGGSAADNLALACGWCNLREGANLSAVDPVTDRVLLLFNPRRHRWAAHLGWDGPVLVGRTPRGRATAALLQVNAPGLVRARRALMRAGEF